MIGSGNFPAASKAHPIAAPAGVLGVWAHQLRVYQWVKNALLFVPIFLGHRALDLPLLGAVAIAALTFSLCASSLYLMNDLVDYQADRRHPTKRLRPLASGLVSHRACLVVAVLLLAVSMPLAASVSTVFLWHLVCYVAASSLYSFRCKRVPVMDVILLAGLYCLRVLAGGVVSETPASHWLLMFCMFFFLSLATAKRYIESTRKPDEYRIEESKRGYLGTDSTLLSAAGVAAGCLSIQVLGLYVSGDDVVKLYRQPQVLWLICPVMLYWILRVWLMAYRGKVNDDPILFAIRDRATYLSAIAVAVVFLIAGPL